MNDVPACEGRDAQRMMAQYKMATEPDESLKFYIGSRCNEWYIKIHGISGNNDEFVGGEYIVKIIAPAKFPYEPPRFYFLTPNGIYQICEKVCISIGEYHKDQYRATLGIYGFCRELWNGMVGHAELGHGINIIQYGAGDKGLTKKLKKIKEFATNSVEYNNTSDMVVNSEGMTLKEINAKIEESYAAYSKQWVENIKKLDDPEECAKLKENIREKYTKQRYILISMGLIPKDNTQNNNNAE